jgi:hypothetical protein
MAIWEHPFIAGLWCLISSVNEKRAEQAKYGPPPPPRIEIGTCHDRLWAGAKKAAYTDRDPRLKSQPDAVRCGGIDRRSCRLREVSNMNTKGKIAFAMVAVLGIGSASAEPAIKLKNAWAMNTLLMKRYPGAKPYFACDYTSGTCQDGVRLTSTFQFTLRRGDNRDVVLGHFLCINDAWSRSSTCLNYETGEHTGSGGPPESDVTVDAPETCVAWNTYNLLPIECLHWQNEWLGYVKVPGGGYYADSTPPQEVTPLPRPRP